MHLGQHVKQITFFFSVNSIQKLLKQHKNKVQQNNFLQRFTINLQVIVYQIVQFIKQSQKCVALYNSDRKQKMNNYTLTRSFVLEKQVTQETKILKGQVRVVNGFADLNPILDQLGDTNLFRFKIYDFSDNKYHRIKDYCPDEEDSYFVPADLLRSDIVLMKFVLDARQTQSIKSGSQSASDTSSIKKQRSKQRTIAQVVEIVKQWREMHTNNTNGRKVNLQQAAEMIGISKKSLDDYYYQLRLGQKYDFDFKMHLTQKVGVLRTFIKDVKTKKKDSRTKVEKHPKKLKIIEQLGGEYEHQLPKSRKKGNNKKSKIDQQDIQNEQDDIQQLDEILEQQKNQQKQQVKQQDAKSIKSIQNQFYNEFEFMGEEPPDPFLNFEGDFKKKSYDDINDQFFF